MEISNRELALLIWLSLVFALGLVRNETRRALGHMLTSVLHPDILLSLAIASLWVLGCILLLKDLCLWTPSNSKTTIVWSLTFAIVSLFGFQKIETDPAFLRNAVSGILSVTAIIVFVAELYSFSLVAEMILLPVLSVVAFMYAIAERKPEYSPVKSLCMAILVMAGIFYFGYGLFNAVGNFHRLDLWFLVREFTHPILLSLLFLPFVYLVYLCVTYQSKFAQLKLWIPDENLRRYAKRAAIKRFQFDLVSLARCELLPESGTLT